VRGITHSEDIKAQDLEAPIAKPADLGAFLSYHSRFTVECDTVECDRLRVDWLHGFSFGSGRGTTRAEDAQGTPTQSHISPSILVYEDNKEDTSDDQDLSIHHSPHFSGAV